ncbi:MAG: M48 family metalloprotease [Snowella sp.]|nr:M48 family metalloprotease [Snowella sp.]
MITPEESLKKLQKGLRSLQQQNYEDAIAKLEDFCECCPDVESPYFVQAQMSLVRAYRGLGEDEKAIALCQAFIHSPHTEVREWGESILKLLLVDEKIEEQAESSFYHSRQGDLSNIQLLMPKVADSLKFAIGITLIWPVIFGFVLIWGLLAIGSNLSLTTISLYALLATLLMNGLFALLSSWLIDQLQARFYQTQPITLSDIQRYSPEAGDLLLRLCREYRLKLPRLGLIPDDRPIIFTYGLSVAQASIVVSQGLLKYLSDEEIAVMYAHEMGHIIHQDFRAMTVASGWGQWFYLAYLWCEKGAQQDSRWRLLTVPVSLVCYGLFQLNDFFNRYLSRTREYYADHFAVTQTGNPNALLYALMKIPVIRIQQDLQAEQAAPFFAGMQNFSSLGTQPSAIAEKAFFFNAEKIEPSIYWDVFNPWSSVYELISSHPLNGKRFQVLTHYAEQLDLRTFFNIAQLRQLATKRKRWVAYLRFFWELNLLFLPLWGIFTVFLLTKMTSTRSLPQAMSLILLGLGLGLLLQTLLLTFSYQRPSNKSIQSLFYTDGTSPIWNHRVNWEGELQALRYKSGWGTWLYFQDQKAIIAVKATFLGKAWQKLFTMNPAEKMLLSQSLKVSGSFRRNFAPYLTLKQIEIGTMAVKCYPLLWRWGIAIALLILSFILK